jgi:hypothetical protein
MKLETARGLFLLASLAVATAAMMAWEQPRPGVLVAEHGAGQCPMPRTPKAQVSARPDHDLLLFMYGMAQGMRPNS